MIIFWTREVVRNYQIFILITFLSFHTFRIVVVHLVASEYTPANHIRSNNTHWKSDYSPVGDHLCARTTRQSQDPVSRVYVYLRENETWPQVLGVFQTAIAKLHSATYHGRPWAGDCGTEFGAQPWEKVVICVYRIRINICFFVVGIDEFCKQIIIIYKHLKYDISNRNKSLYSCQLKLILFDTNYFRFWYINIKDFHIVCLTNRIVIFSFQFTHRSNETQGNQIIRTKNCSMIKHSSWFLVNVAKCSCSSMATHFRETMSLDRPRTGVVATVGKALYLAMLGRPQPSNPTGSTKWLWHNQSIIICQRRPTVKLYRTHKLKKEKPKTIVNL